MRFRIIESLQDHTSKNYIRWFFDRYTRSWVISVYNENNIEIDSSYVGNKVSRDFEIDRFRNLYQTLDARKFSANEPLAEPIITTTNDIIKVK